LRIFLVLLAALLAGTVAGAADDVGTDAVRMVTTSVAPVECLLPASHAAIRGVSGTAFFVNAQGYFVTARHVLAGMVALGSSCTAVVLIPHDGWNDETSPGTREVSPFDATTCVTDDRLDLAACRDSDDVILGAFARGFFHPVTFRTSALPDGTAVAFTGFPQGYAWPLTAEGWLSTSTPVDSLPALTIDGQSWHGMSGAPVYLGSGEVAGVMLAAETDDQAGLSVARPASVVVEFLRAHAIEVRVK
jgi:hypothetical protein